MGKKKKRNNPYIKINVQSTDIISGSLFPLLHLLLLKKWHFLIKSPKDEGIFSYHIEVAIRMHYF